MNIQEMMKQAKMMQDRMQALQDKLAEIDVTSESGGGMVRVTMSAKGELREITISPEIIDPEQRETLEDLVKAAINLARKTADERLASETQTLMRELGLPPNINLPF